jgi:ABC-type maltose transport system permease subunit
MSKNVHQPLLLGNIYLLHHPPFMGKHHFLSNLTNMKIYRFTHAVCLFALPISVLWVNMREKEVNIRWKSIMN